MSIHFSIAKNDIELAKYKIRKRIQEGDDIDKAIIHGVKYIQKIINKKLPKHITRLLDRARYKFITDFKINKEHLVDPMKLLNMRVNTSESQNTNNTTNTCE